MHTVTPAVNTDSVKTFVQRIESAKTVTSLPAVHVDIIDGLFADVTTVAPLDLTVVEFGHLQIDLHLMVEEPMDTVFECEAIREYLPIRQVIAQVERMSSQADFLDEVKSARWQAGLALDLYTPLEAIDDESWAQMNSLLLLSVEAGQAEAFHPYVLQKLEEFEQRKEEILARRNGAPIEIILDGGLTTQSARQVLAAGATQLVVGRTLWKESGRLAQALETFQAL